MELFLDPQAWLSFLTLSLLEVVLGIDNIIFLAILVDRLPEARRRSARYLGLSFAAITRIALLLSVVWLTRLRAPLFRWFDEDVSVRDLALLGGGILLVVQSVKEIRDMLRHRTARRETGSMRGYWLIIAQVGVIDIVFSFDTVFTAVGLSNHVEVMVAAILVSVAVMMAVSAGVGAFINRHPTIKTLALCLPRAGRHRAARRVGAHRNSPGLLVFCDGVLRGGGVGQHPLATPGVTCRVP